MLGLSTHADAPQRLNNLVSELAHARRAEAGHTLTFNNPRDGWVYISLTAHADEKLGARGEDGTAWILQNSPPRPGALESMRWLAAGSHTLTITGANGAHARDVVVRAVPETQFVRYPQEPKFPALGDFNWQWLKDNVLSPVNTLAALPGPAADAAIDEWTNLGRKCIAYGGVPQGDALTAPGVFDTWHNNAGFNDPRLSGMIADEFSGRQYRPYPAWTEAMRLLGDAERGSGRKFYAYCGGPGMFSRPESRALVQTVLDAGFYMAWERYLHEVPTLEEGNALIDQMLGKEIALWRAALPECQRKMLVVLGEFATGPDLDIEPGVNYKVWIDLQMRYLATHPGFDGLFGVQWWYSGGANEELLRWQSALYRHYCIEGATDLYSERFGWHYESGHIQNPDFHEGMQAWTIDSGSSDTLQSRYLERYAKIQNRYWNRGIEPDYPHGNAYLWMKSDTGATRAISQEIHGLVPGKLYSAQMITADYQDITHGRSIKKQHAITLSVDGAQSELPGSYHAVEISSPWSHDQLPFKDGPAWFNHHRVLFRATAPTAQLTINDNGAPNGQELMINHVQVEPYYE